MRMQVCAFMLFFEFKMTTAKTNTRKTSTVKKNAPEIIVKESAPEELNNFDKKGKKIAEKISGETVIISCSLPHGLKFDDVPDRKGGFKTIVFPGLNDSLKGKKTGILLGAGYACTKTLAKEDWENIKKKHGKERAFQSWNGLPPCLYELKNKDEWDQKQDEIAQQDHGLNPIDPESVGVEARKDEQ